MSSKVVCPLCGSGKLDLIANKVRFGKDADVYKCKDCSLVLLDKDSFALPDDFYEKEYHQTYITHVEPDALDPKAYYEKMTKSTKIWADKFSKMLSGREVVLDVGCSTGHFMNMVKNKTKKIYGYDLNPEEVKFCKNVLNLDVSSEPLKDRFKEGTFDFITLIYVLEHIVAPQDFLSSIKKFLKPNGKFVILVPNVQDALVSFFDIPEFRSFYYCIEHLFYYNPDTLKILFDKVGLKGNIEVIQEYPITNHLNWAYRMAPSDTIASRKEVPDISLIDTTQSHDWNELWNKFNQLYQVFLNDNGFGDRIWCKIGICE